LLTGDGSIGADVNLPMEPFDAQGEAAEAA
jgi:hypothetical protein